MVSKESKDLMASKAVEYVRFEFEICSEYVAIVSTCCCGVNVVLPYRVIEGSRGRKERRTILGLKYA